ncbi:MAG: prepilin peptidase [Proteobacteria bacterium]|nr:prepilin peptidase [Pseudomonadota bacterium]
MSVFDLLAASPGLFIGTCLVLGLLVGSFLNVVIYRLPIILERQWQQECAELHDTEVAVPTEPFNLVFPRSACPSCKAPITALQNVPILSWLMLRGRCAACGIRISARYPLIEALTGVLSAAIAWKFGYGWQTAAAIVLTWFLIALTFIDIDTQFLPDTLTLPLVWMGLLLSLWASEAAPAPLPVDMRSSIIGAIAGYLSLWSVYHLFRLITGKEGMGYGDFKLFAALGAWLGWQMLLPIMLFAATVGAVVGIGLIALRGRNRATPIAFGPFLAAGGWLVLMFGHEVVTGYLGMFAPRP